jgi:sortase A
MGRPSPAAAARVESFDPVPEAHTVSPKMVDPVVPEDGVVTRTKSRGAAALLWFGAIVTGLGLFLALFAAYLFVFSPIQASRSQHRLLADLQGPPGLAALTGHVPPEGKAVAVMQIPALKLDQVVVEGTSSSDLVSGPGLMPGSAIPGTPGNTVIAGRRYLYGKPFSALGSLKPGDVIKVVSAYGLFEYKVARTFTVQPGQQDPIGQTADNQLTLVTSNSSLAPSARVVTIAKLVGSPVDAHVSKLGLPPTSERALSGQPSSLLPTLLWFLALMVGLFVTVRLYRRWNHTWPTYIMTTPVLLAFAVLVFQNAAHLLPATL